MVHSYSPPRAPAMRALQARGCRLDTRGVRRRRLVSFFAAAGAVLVVLALIVPTLVARIVAGRLSTRLRTPLHVGRPFWNPLPRTSTLHGLRPHASRHTAELA